MPWELIHHIADLAGLAVIVIGIVSSRLEKWKKLREWIVEDHRKIGVMWRDHGYGQWDGAERRGENR